MKLLPLILLLAACGDNGSTDIISDVDAGEVTPQRSFGYVVGTTYDSPGVLTSLNFDDDEFVNSDQLSDWPLGSDSILRDIGGEVYVINRSADSNIMFREADAIAQISTLDDAPNPQDLTVIGDHIYVVSLDGGDVVKYNLTTKDVAKKISIADLDEDGQPDCNSIVAVGTHVYVTCGILDRENFWTPRQNGVVAAIDTLTDTVVNTHTISTANPFGLIEVSGDGKLMVNTTDFSTGGCMQEVSVSGPNITSECIYENSILGGGYPAHTTLAGNDFWVVVAAWDADAMETVTALHTINRTDKTLSAPLSAEGHRPYATAACTNGNILVADRINDGVHFYNADGPQENKSLVNVGLPPASIICD